VKIISLAREKKVTMFIRIFYIPSKKFYEIQKRRQNFLKVIQLKKSYHPYNENISEFIKMNVLLSALYFL